VCVCVCVRECVFVFIYLFTYLLFIYLFIYLFFTVIAPLLNVPELSFQLKICPPRKDLSVDTGTESLAPTAAERRAPVAQH